MANIESGFSFKSKRYSFSISNYKKCLDEYSSKLDNVLTLKNELPIFLDANVLLRYYSISFTAREKLFDFIKEKLDRIYITEQVQFEFLKNREEVIQRFFEQVTSKIPRDFNSDVVNKMKSFFDTHKVVLKDYPFMELGINKHHSELEDLLSKLNEAAEKKKKENDGLIMNDPFIELLSKCKINFLLSTTEKEYLKKEFDELAKPILTDNIDSLLNRPYYVFPGMGDIKMKPDDPYGDYIIYHELLKFAEQEKTDCLFLTFDNTKGDWMQKSKLPHLHFIQNFYENTSKILYILDAERTLEDLLNVNIDSLVRTEFVSIKGEDLTIAGIEKLFSENEIFKNVFYSKMNEGLLKELTANGYTSLSQINAELNRGFDAVQKFSESEDVKLSTIGVLRVCLKIVNPNYIKQVNSYGEIIESPEMFKHFDPYRKFVKP